MFVVPTALRFRQMFLPAALLSCFLFTACSDKPGDNETGNGRKTGKTAVMLVNHGSRSEQWKKNLLELERKVSEEINAIEGVDTLVTAFPEHGEPSIAAALKDLDRKKYSDVIVIPVFLSVSSHVFDDLPTIIGKKENPATIEQMKLEGIERYVASAKTHLAKPLDFSDLLGSNVLGRARLLSTDPADEGIVLVGYGSTHFDDEWKELFEKTGDEVCRKGRFASYTTAWCGHRAHYSPDSTTAAINRILTKKRRAIVIPLLVSVSKRFQLDIIGTGVDNVGRNRSRIRYKPDAILPDSCLETWIVETAAEHAAEIRNEKK